MKHLLRGLVAAFALATSATAADVQHHVVFTYNAPLATAPELLRRMYTPLSAAPFGGIAGLPLDLTKESFTVFVPPAKPANGYALMVFVPPWNDAGVPVAWLPALRDNGVIFVSADNSGNNQEVHVRRVPLAITAAQNIMQQYDVDPSRVFIAGLSGGARVAFGLALAYPDLFRGAFLNSGSDPIGTARNPLPPADLFNRFQTSSRIYFVTGDADQGPLHDAQASANTLDEFCVANVTSLTVAHMGHALADGDTFEKVLLSLLNPAPATDRPDCRAKLAATVQLQLAQVEALIASGDKRGARQLLNEIDAKYGGLAAPKSPALNAELH